MDRIKKAVAKARGGESAADTPPPRTPAAAPARAAEQQLVYEAPDPVVDAHAEAEPDTVDARQPLPPVWVRSDAPGTAPASPKRSSLRRSAMERIKRAIESARGGTPERVRQAPPAGMRQAAPASAQSGELEAVRYQQTRVVELDPAHLEANRIVVQKKGDPNALLFDRLRTQVLAEMREQGWNALAITSPGPNCGKTVVAINLAMSIAQKTGQSVLLANFDLRQPSISACMGLPFVPSLADYLAGEVDVAEMLVNPGVQRLVVMPNNRAVANATETLVLARTRELVAELKQRYASRIVIFDLPPLQPTDDAIAFLPQVDCVLLVTADGETTSSELEECQRLLRDTNVVGTVLNKADIAGAWMQRLALPGTATGSYGWVDSEPLSAVALPQSRSGWWSSLFSRRGRARKQASQG